MILARCYLSWLLHKWLAAGRLARRVAVIGAGEFSREFIQRLRSEPNAYTVVGLYDDRLSAFRRYRKVFESAEACEIFSNGAVKSSWTSSSLRSR